MTEPITPIDVVHQTFKHRLFGCDPREVQEFLEKVAAGFGAALQEADRLRQELTCGRQMLQEKEKEHEDLRTALALAEKAADQMRSNAQKEAELIVRQGQEDARRIVEQARDQAAEIQRQVEAGNQQKLRLHAEMRALLQSHMSMLSSLESSPSARAQSEGGAAPSSTPTPQAEASPPELPGEADTPPERPHDEDSP